MKNIFYCNSFHDFKISLILCKIVYELKILVVQYLQNKERRLFFMNLKRLYEFQRKLDKGLQDKLDVQEKSLLPQKLVALQAKIGELATETQCFKFWVSKKSPVRRKVLEKYIESLYLALSIGIQKDYTETEFTVKETECELTQQLLNIFIDMNDFMVSSSKDHYITLIEDLLTLSVILDLSEDEILNSNKQVYTA
jgi:dimeric dUTPase (all-alpha-NTP-PPase superfamily)